MSTKNEQDSSRPESRRDFITRVLRTTAYTAPIVAGMSMANLAVAQASMGMGMMGGGMMGGGMMGMP